MLLGVLTPTKGEVLYFGKNLWKFREEISEQINFSSTYTNLPMDLSVKDALNYTSYLYKIENRKERLREIKKDFELDEVYNQKIANLSSGQLTRVNLAKAFLNYPKILLLDEPTASLDPEVATYIRKFILRKRKKFNLSILITSHNMSEVEEICDRVIFINNGKIVANDTPKNLAKSVDIIHVELLIKDGLKRLKEYCEKCLIKNGTKSRYVVVDLKEKDLTDFFRRVKSARYNF
jgi:ABC-2 type transport system ATP-binding protein